VREREKAEGITTKVMRGDNPYLFATRCEGELDTAKVQLSAKKHRTQLDFGEKGKLLSGRCLQDDGENLTEEMLVLVSGKLEEPILVERKKDHICKGICMQRLELEVILPEIFKQNKLPVVLCGKSCAKEGNTLIRIVFCIKNVVELSASTKN
jgi:hypothetical protein